MAPSNSWWWETSALATLTSPLGCLSVLTICFLHDKWRKRESRKEASLPACHCGWECQEARFPGGHLGVWPPLREGTSRGGWAAGTSGRWAQSQIPSAPSCTLIKCVCPQGGAGVLLSPAHPRSPANVFSIWSLCGKPVLTQPEATAHFPRGTSGKESARQCRRCKRHRFNPWVEKIP